jgi:transposase
MDGDWLPDDSGVLKDIIARQWRHIAELEQQKAALERSNEQIAHELEIIKKGLFQRKAEYVDPRQLPLLAGSEPAVEPPPSPPGPRRKGRSRHGRQQIPRHVPRQRCELKVSEEATCISCGGPLQPIDEAVSERLEWVPGHFVAIEVRRQKCACPRCPSQGVVTAPGPQFTLDRALPGDGLLAQVLVNKFADHIPLNRQARIFRRQGVSLATSTLSGWVRAGATVSKPIVVQVKKELLASDWIQADETSFLVLEGSKNRRRKGYLWGYGNHEHVIFDYTASREMTHPAQFLEGFEGVLQCDGYSGYNLIAEANGVTRAGCWSHARRYFYEVLQTAREPHDRESCRMALAYIHRLFQIEGQLRGVDQEVRQRVRQEKTAPLLEDFHRWLRLQGETTRAESPYAKAVTYVLNQWDPLTVFLHEPTVPAHNNGSERNLRQAVLGRKNWMFAGSAGGARAAAIMFSLVGSCLLNGVDPWSYLREVLPRVKAQPERAAELTPAAWARR